MTVDVRGPRAPVPARNVEQDYREANDYQPICFSDGRGYDDSVMLSDSLDMFSLSIDSIDS